MRKKILTFALTTLILASVHLAQAQQLGKVYRIGILCRGNCDTPTYKTFRQGLRELGYIEGQNSIVEERAAKERYERLPDLAAELVQLKVDVILAAGGTEAPRAVKEASKTIPIVFVIADDPISAGLVTSFARPGGNITGFSSMNAELDGKRLELLKEAVPKVSRVAVLFNALDPAAPAMWRATEASARSLGVQLQRSEVRGPDEFDSAIGAAAKGGAGALTVLGSPMFFQYQPRIAELTTKTKLPAISPWRQLPEAGGFMSYGADISDMFRRAATYVDKILKGAKPADLPVERPIKFELVINLKTAKALGLTIPQSVLYRADKVIK